MTFGHHGEDDDSIFKLVDQLQRGLKTPGDTNEPLDVAQHKENFCSISNRRLTALMMYQALPRDFAVKAWCTIRSSDTQKFEEANSTENEGLGIDDREAHFGAPLFLRSFWQCSASKILLSNDIWMLAHICAFEHMYMHVYCIFFFFFFHSCIARCQSTFRKGCTHNLPRKIPISRLWAQSSMSGHVKQWADVN